MKIDELSIVKRQHTFPLLLLASMVGSKLSSTGGISYERLYCALIVPESHKANRYKYNESFYIIKDFFNSYSPLFSRF